MSRVPTPSGTHLTTHSAAQADAGPQQDGWNHHASPHAQATHAAGSAGKPKCTSPEVWTEAQRDPLALEFHATLQRGVPGLCFSPYLEGQQPGSQINETQIRKRLAIIKPHTGWVRSFSCTDGREQTPRVAPRQPLGRHLRRRAAERQHKRKPGRAATTDRAGAAVPQLCFFSRRGQRGDGGLDRPPGARGSHD